MRVNIIKVGYGVTDRGISNGPQDTNGVTQLLQCFEE